MQVIHTAFCTAITCFAMVGLIMRKERMHFSFSLDKNDPYFPLFPILALIFVTMGFYMFNKQIRAIDPMATGDGKIAAYQTAFILRCAFIESAALLNLGAFLILGNLLYLIVAAVALIIFIWIRPARQTVIDTLNLQFPDTEKL